MGSTLSAYYLESSQMRLWSQTQPDLPENVHYFFSPGTEGEVGKQREREREREGEGERERNREERLSAPSDQAGQGTEVLGRVSWLAGCSSGAQPSLWTFGGNECRGWGRDPTRLSGRTAKKILTFTPV